MSIWMNGKSLFSEKKKELYGNLNMEDITYAY